MPESPPEPTPAPAPSTVAGRRWRLAPWAGLAAAVLLAALLLGPGGLLHGLGGFSTSEAAAWVLQRQQQMLAAQQAAPWWFAGGFFGLFVLLAATTVPGCSLMCLAAGLLFGFWGGTVLVAAASTVAAMAAFVAARHWLAGWIARRHAGPLARLQSASARHGALMLFSLRLLPVLPFTLLNPLMGLTRMSLRQFAWISFVGMLPGSALYVWAGTELARVAAGGSLATPSLWAALALLAALPWLLRAAQRRWAVW